jgi:lysosomal Pro-X carboxypeptidase
VIHCFTAVLFFRNFSSTETGRKSLNSKFNFCNSSLINKPEDWKPFYEFLQDVLGNLAMANYPYPANFLADLPAYPVREFCGQINKIPTNDEDLVSAFNEAVQIYTNFTGKTKCIDTSTAYDSSLGSKGWNFQACTEMVMPMCSLGTTDMFLPDKWDFTQYSNDCFKKFGVRPREKFAITQYGAQKLDAASNIIFSNGLLDPWSGGGVLRTFSNSIDVVLIPEGAHHLDLRSKDHLDPQSVKIARKFHMKKFQQWISSYASNLSN